jgi:hypothetical protein
MILTLSSKYKLLTGEDGEKLQEKVWHELLDSLRKENPEVMEIAKS